MDREAEGRGRESIIEEEEEEEVHSPVTSEESDAVCQGQQSGIKDKE